MGQGDSFDFAPARRNKAGHGIRREEPGRGFPRALDESAEHGSHQIHGRHLAQWWIRCIGTAP